MPQLSQGRELRDRKAEGALDREQLYRLPYAGGTDERHCVADRGQTDSDHDADPLDQGVSARGIATVLFCRGGWADTDGIGHILLLQLAIENGFQMIEDLGCF